MEWETIEEFTQLTKNFNMVEFLCRCGKQFCAGLGDPTYKKQIFSNIVRTAEHLQKFRDDFCESFPIIVLSGIRCYVHNINVGGARNSLHLLGCAADILCKKMTPDELLIRVKRSRIWGGVGNYIGQGFVHVDIGDRREW